MFEKFKLMKAIYSGLDKEFTKDVSLNDPLKFQNLFAEYLNINASDEKYVGAIYDAIDVWSTWFAKANFRLYKRTRKGNEEIKDHPALMLFNNPNHYSTWWKFAYMIPAHLGLFGSFYIYIIRNKKGEPIAYQYLLPSVVKRKVEAGKGLTHYEYVVDEKTLKIQTKDILDFSNPNPYSEFEGLPIISAVADIATVNQLQMDYSKKFYEQGGFMGLTFSTKADMTPNSFEQTLQRLKQQYGGKDNSFKVGLMDNGLSPVKSAHNMQEMDITNQRRLTREDIFASFHVPKIMVGLGESTNRASAESAIYTFTSGTIDPRLSYVDAVITQFVKREFGKDYYVKHDTLAPKDQEGALNYYDKMSKLGAMTINEIREEEGFDPFAFPLADASLINVGGALINVEKEKQIAVDDEGTDQSSSQSESSESGNKEDTKKRIDGQFSLFTKSRETRWKQFETRHTTFSRRFENRIKGYIGDQSRRIIEALKDNEVVGAVFNIENEDVLLYQLLEIELYSIMSAGYRFGALEHNIDPKVNRTIFYDPYQALSKNIATFNQTIQRGLSNLDELTEENIQKVYDKIDAQSIAVTGTTGAFNAGLLQSLRDAGIEYKSWLSMRDDRVRTPSGTHREDHVTPDGKSIPLEEPFLLPNRAGGYDRLMYPGDPAGSPENLINDRCTIQGENQ